MNATVVIHIRNAPMGWETNPQYVYIGRAGHGLDGYYGNPILTYEKCPICGKIHVGAGTIKCFEQYLINRCKTDTDYFNRIKALYGKTLVCFCKPHPCHGDIYKKYADMIHDNKGVL